MLPMMEKPMEMEHDHASPGDSALGLSALQASRPIGTNP